MTEFHKYNAGRDVIELIRAGVDEVVEMEKRQNAHLSMVMQRTIPARGDDSDVLLVDALRMARDKIETLKAQNAALVKAAVRAINCITIRTEPDEQWDTLHDLQSAIDAAEATAP